MIDTSARLIAVSYVGELGVAKRTETPTDILCQLGSVNRTEFYAAYNSGFRPEYRVTTAPVNYAGQTLIELDTPDGPVLCDIYRTYRKSLDVLELWCCLHNPDAVQVFTLFTAGKKVTLHGAYLTGSDGESRERTGAVAIDTVSLILPQTLQAFVGATPLPAMVGRKLQQTKAAVVLQPLFVAVMLILVTGCLVDGSFNPFLYFRF